MPDVFQLLPPSKQTFLFGQILDILVVINFLSNGKEVPEDRQNEIDQLIQKLNTQKNLTIKNVLEEFGKNAIIFETCNGKLKYNTILEGTSDEFIMLAFDDKTLYPIKIREADNDIYVLNRSQAAQIFAYAQTLKEPLKCTYKLGSIVKLRAAQAQIQTFQVCEVKGDMVILLNNIDKTYFSKAANEVEPAEDSTTEKELLNRVLEADSPDFTDVEYKVENFEVFYKETLTNLLS